MQPFSVTITNLQDEIAANIKLINCGGCGFFCKYVAEYLERHKLPYEIKTLHQFEPDNLIKEMNNFRNNKTFDKWSIIANHYIIRFNDYYFDSVHYKQTKSTLTEFNGYKIINLDITLDELNVLLVKAEWNDTYQRKQNEKLKSIINLHLDEYFTNFA